MKLIAAVDKNWAIGKNGKLLVSIPEDMKLFRETTSGKVVVMGRKTLESFPGGRPLKNRVNVVLTTDKSYQPEGVVVCHSLEEALEKLKKYKSDDIYVIGGGSIYRQFLPYCDTALITEIDFAYDADTSLPDLSRLEEWRVAECSDEKTYYDLEYYFKTYVRLNK
jgi:dihydrofolate reductase